jgi:hypothetical protein
VIPIAGVVGATKEEEAEFIFDFDMKRVGDM